MEEPLVFNDKHNICAYLETDDPKSADYRVMIGFIRGLHINYAITTDVQIYEDIIREFWENAEVSMVHGVPTIISSVDNHEIFITEEVIRRVLQLDDLTGDTEYSEEVIMAGYRRMGYEGDYDRKTIRKTYLSHNWRFLLNIGIHCLGNRKGGFDEVPGILSSGILALTKGRKYNFSRMILHGLRSNIQEQNKHKYLMYPRFLQLMINDLLQKQNLNTGTNILIQKHMNVHVFSHVKSKHKRSSFSGTITPLFGPVIGEPYDLEENENVNVEEAEHAENIADEPVYEAEYVNGPLHEEERVGNIGSEPVNEKVRAVNVVKIDGSSSESGDNEAGGGTEFVYDSATKHLGVPRVLARIGVNEALRKCRKSLFASSRKGKRVRTKSINDESLNPEVERPLKRTSRKRVNIGTSERVSKPLRRQHVEPEVQDRPYNFHNDIEIPVPFINLRNKVKELESKLKVKDDEIAELKVARKTQDVKIDEMSKVIQIMREQLNSLLPKDIVPISVFMRTAQHDGGSSSGAQAENVGDGETQRNDRIMDEIFAGELNQENLEVVAAVQDKGKEKVVKGEARKREKLVITDARGDDFEVSLSSGWSEYDVSDKEGDQAKSVNKSVESAEQSEFDEQVGMTVADINAETSSEAFKADRVAWLKKILYFRKLPSL